MDLPLNLGLPPVGLSKTSFLNLREKRMREKREGMLEKNEVPKCPMAVNPLLPCKCLICCKDLTEVCLIIS